MKKIIFIFGLILPTLAIASVQNISTFEVLDNVTLADSFERAPDCPSGQNCTAVMDHFIKLGVKLPACGSSVKSIHYSLNSILDRSNLSLKLYVTAFAHANIIKKISVKTDALGNKTTTEIPCLEEQELFYEIKTDGFFEKENIFLNETLTL